MRVLLLLTTPLRASLAADADPGRCRRAPSAEAPGERRGKVFLAAAIGQAERESATVTAAQAGEVGERLEGQAPLSGMGERLEQQPQASGLGKRLWRHSQAG